MIDFYLPIIPTAQKRARHGRLANGHSVTYKDAGQRQNEGDLISLMAPHAPENPISGPVVLSVSAVFPIPESWTKKKKDKALARGGFMVSKPDLDNLVKQVMDCMTKLRFWDDDKQVIEIKASKLYPAIMFGPSKVGWYISLRELDIQD